MKSKLNMDQVTEATADVVVLSADTAIEAINIKKKVISTMDKGKKSEETVDHTQMKIKCHADMRRNEAKLKKDFDDILAIWGAKVKTQEITKAFKIVTSIQDLREKMAQPEYDGTELLTSTKEAISSLKQFKEKAPNMEELMENLMTADTMEERKRQLNHF